VMLRDGTLAVETSREWRDSSRYDDGRKATFRTLDGQRVSSNQRVEMSSPIPIRPEPLEKSPQNYRDRRSIMRDFVTNDSSVKDMFDGRGIYWPNGRPYHWIYWPHDHTVIAYDSANWPVMSFGPSGVRHAPKPPEPFPDPFPTNPLLNRHDVYWMVPGTNEVSHLHFADETLVASPRDIDYQGHHTFFLTDRNVYAISRPGEPAAILPLDGTLRDQAISLMVSNDFGYLLRYQPRWTEGQVRLEHFDLSGKHIRTASIDVSHAALMWQTPLSYPDIYVYTNARIDSAAAGMISAMGSSWSWMPFLKWDASSRILYLMMRFHFMGMLIIHLLALLTMIRLARRYYLRRLPTIAWTLAALLLGPWMLLLFAATRRMPARVACPSCSKLRPFAADRCPHCQALFPAPLRNGTEIFA
jgi:hypothetical protein